MGAGGADGVGGNPGSMRLVEGAVGEPKAASGAASRDHGGEGCDDSSDDGDGMVKSWALQLLLDEVKRTTADLDPNRAALLLQKIEARQRSEAGGGRASRAIVRRERVRGWLTRVMNMLVFWAAAIAGSRAFRMLTL